MTNLQEQKRAELFAENITEVFIDAEFQNVMAYHVPPDVLTTPEEIDVMRVMLSNPGVPVGMKEFNNKLEKNNRTKGDFLDKLTIKIGRTGLKSAIRRTLDEDDKLTFTYMPELLPVPQNPELLRRRDVGTASRPELPARTSHIRQAAMRLRTFQATPYPKSKIEYTKEQLAFLDLKSSIGFCKGTDNEKFFQEKGSHTEAKRICANCVIKQECRDFGIVTNQKHGVWGGTSNKERRLIRRRLRLEAQDDDTDLEVAS